MAQGAGARARERRLAGGLTQAQVAEVLALDTSAVSRIEKGDRHLSAFELGVLAETFGWDPRELLGIERPRHKLAVAARLRDAGGSPDQAFARMAALVEVDALLDDVGVEETPGPECDDTSTWSNAATALSTVFHESTVAWNSGLGPGLLFQGTGTTRA